MIEKNKLTNTFLYYGVKRFFDIIFSLLLLFCLWPIFILLILLVGLFNRCFYGTLIRPLGLLGLIIGFSGVSVIMIDRFNGTVDIRGVLACSTGVIAFTFATVFVRSAASGGNVLMIVGLQMIVGGLTLAIISLFIENWTINWSTSVFFAFTYTFIIERFKFQKFSII